MGSEPRARRRSATSSNEYRFPTPTVWNLLGSVALVACAVWMVVDPAPTERLGWMSPTVRRVLGLVVGVLFGAAAVWQAVQLYRRRPTRDG